MRLPQKYLYHRVSYANFVIFYLNQHLYVTYIPFNDSPSFARLNHGLEKYFGSDYFTENFQVKENKTKMRNIHQRFFHLLF